MPPSARQRWHIVALALIAMHLVLLFSISVLREPLGLEKLNDSIMLGTVYLPLVPWRMAEAPVLEATAQMFQPPNALGWAIVALSWAFLYAAIAYLLSALVGRLK